MAGGPPGDRCRPGRVREWELAEPVGRKAAGLRELAGGLGARLPLAGEGIAAGLVRLVSARLKVGAQVGGDPVGCRGASRGYLVQH